MKNKLKNLILFIILVLLLIILSSVFIILPKNNTNDFQENKVIEVIDGDTFVLSSGEKVRMICIDAPEITSARGEESKAFLQNLLLGKEVRLEKDITDKDNYYRLLRYVYVNSSEGEVFVNREMVRAGMAKAFRYGNDTSKCDEIESNAKF